MRVPDEVRQCVAFIGVDSTKFGGTGFFVNIPSLSIPNAFYSYFVTAKHVADNTIDRDFVVRMNKIDGPAVPVLSQKGTTRWWLHPTDNTDVAVMPLRPDSSVIEWKGIPESMFVTDQVIRDNSLGTGDEVFITGLFTQVTGSTRNIPIVRAGHMAMMPGERVPTKLGPMEAYLIEARSIGGVSGSPVFVRETIVLPMTKPGQIVKPENAPYLSGSGRFWLLGLMHGHWDVAPSAINDDAFDANGKVNMGIAIVMPATKILETLYHPELVDMRKKGDEKASEANQPQMDSEFSTVSAPKTRDIEVLEHPDKAKFFSDLGKVIQKREKK
jgi:hypothetical protein